jgi:hypothetical protein
MASHPSEKVSRNRPRSGRVSRQPAQKAQSRGDSSIALSTLTSAPFWSKYRMISTAPIEAAQWSNRCPLLLSRVDSRASRFFEGLYLPNHRHHLQYLQTSGETSSLSNCKGWDSKPGDSLQRSVNRPKFHRLTISRFHLQYRSSCPNSA